MTQGKIALTGGGTAGHVTANIALLPQLRRDGFDIFYIGSFTGIEKELIEKEDVRYYGIDTGKLRRYMSVKNLTDPAHVIHGYMMAKSILKKEKPDIIFSKGGFVAVPVVLAAKSLGIPVVTHESDMTPGLANKITLSSASKICCNFPETINALPKNKAVLTGSPIREALLQGTREEGMAFTGYKGDKPVLMIIGGSMGSVAINECVRALLPKLLPDFDVIHVCGRGNASEALKDTAGYKQYEYVSGELRNLYALADVVISRAGANVICELLALRKPNILIPLPLAQSRGDQILNAESFEKQGFSYMLRQEKMTEDTLHKAINYVYENRDKYTTAMQNSNQGSGVDAVIQVLRDVLADRKVGK